MSTLYLLALGGVAFMLIAAFVEALLAVSRKRDGTVIKQPQLRLVEGGDRRARHMPFVGADRRASQLQDLDRSEQRRRA